MSYKNRIIVFLLVAVAAWLQNTEMLTLYGVKPNLALVLLIILAGITSSLVFFSSLVIVSVLVLQNVFFVSWPTIVFILLTFLIFFLLKRLPWRTTINIFTTIVLFSVIFLILVEPLFVINNVRVIIQELIYNVILGIILYSALFYFFKQQYLSPIRSSDA